MLPLILIVIGLCAFGLGRLSALKEAGPRLVINGAPEVSSNAAAVGLVSQEEAQSGGVLVASKSGSKYYLPTCSGASRIKEENKVWFVSAEEAEASGYEPAANCPGL